MGWFTPVSREEHPCRLPSTEEAVKQERQPGEYWRCEVCDDLWRYRGAGYFVQASVWERWKHRRAGYTEVKDESVS